MPRMQRREFHAALRPKKESAAGESHITRLRHDNECRQTVTGRPLWKLMVYTWYLHYTADEVIVASATPAMNQQPQCHQAASAITAMQQQPAPIQTKPDKRHDTRLSNAIKPHLQRKVPRLPNKRTQEAFRPRRKAIDQGQKPEARRHPDATTTKRPPLPRLPHKSTAKHLPRKSSRCPVRPSWIEPNAPLN